MSILDNRTYFTSDGSYGEAKGLVILPTENWTDKEWEEVANMGDDERFEFATMLHRKMIQDLIDRSNKTL